MKQIAKSNDQEDTFPARLRGGFKEEWGLLSGNVARSYTKSLGGQRPSCHGHKDRVSGDRWAPHSLVMLPGAWGGTCAEGT